ncbi:IS3 family transposase [Bulleidia sp. zg-1006]|nr:IS3 family transposase [Trueperella sp. zg.1013]QRG86205.1 IS3 family transposase [Bulleidia sp. zg-1006]
MGIINIDTNISKKSSDNGYEELKSEIERYIRYYNEQRIKEKLGWMPPVQYRIASMCSA